MAITVAPAHAQSAATQPNAAGNEDLARARFLEGRAAYDAHAYKRALTSFRASFELSRRPELLYNVGLAAQKLGRSAEALAAFEGYLAWGKGERADEVRGRVAALRDIAEQKPATRMPEAAAERSPRSARVAEPPTTQAPVPASSAPSFALAPPRTARRVLQLYGGLGIGMMGDLSLEIPDYAVRLDGAVDLGVSAGLQAGAGLVWRFLGLAVEFRYAWADPRFEIWELVLKPRAGYKFSPLPLELYVALPHGLGGASIGDAFHSLLLEIGVLAGASYFFEHVGLNAELGYKYLDGVIASGLHVSTLSQLTLHVNAVYAF